MNARTLLVFALGASVAAAAGCGAAGSDGSAALEGQLRPVERHAVGEAAEYPADTSLRGRLDELTRSKKARREAAWAAVARVLAPVRIAGEVREGDAPATLPTFRTWYGKDDFARMFGEMYADLSPDERAARRPFTADEAARAFTWNATDLGASSADDYAARLALVGDDAAVQGLGGNHRVVYSPGLIRHLLGHYGEVSACLPKLAADAFAADDPPPSSTNFAPCFSAEFPSDAALVKMSWYRANFGAEHLTIPVYDTSAETLAAKVAGTDADRGGWGKGQGEADPGEDEIYTVAMSDGTRFRMPAMHIVTKELREWLWITLWWAPNPDEDFGADRPESITKLGAPWDHYKMNVVVSYEEKDPDPRGGFEGSLGDALAAVHSPDGGPSWASNPYVEKGSPNAQSNCIGCHQHAGTRETSESILARPESFPMTARTRVRKNFPSDYLWALANRPERLGGIIDAQVQHYDAVDR